MPAWLLILALGTAALMVLLRVAPLVRILRRFAWQLLQVEERCGLLPPRNRLTHLVRTALIGGSRLVRAVLLAGVSLHLRIDDFSGKIEGADGDGDEKAIGGPTVAAIVRVGMLRTAATGGSTPLFVAAPFGAATAFSEVAAAVSDVSERGKLAAAAMRLLSLLARVLGRDELVLSGRVLSSGSRGPGIAVVLSHANGLTVDSRTLWADTYEVGEASEGGSTASPGDPTDRILRVAVAAAVWTQFSLLREYGVLTPEDFRWLIGTSEWESYAFHQVAAVLKPEHSTGDPAIRCLFAHALDRDPRNFDARFNFDAECAASDASLGDSLEDLKALQQEVEEEKKERGKRQWLTPWRPEILEPRVPFHCQVVIRRSVLAMERWQRYRHRPDRDPRQEATLLRDLREAWEALTGDLEILERALLEVERVGNHHANWGRHWASSLTVDSSEETVRIVGFLRELEGRMLAAWASIAVHLEPKAPRPSGLAAGSERPAPAQAAEIGRDELLDLLSGRGNYPAPHETVVEGFLLRGKALLDETTRYNLACYFADRREREQVLAQLRRALGTHHRCKRALEDEQLKEFRPDIERICNELGAKAESEPPHPVFAAVIL